MTPPHVRQPVTREEHGFTLIELLVVIIIIGILAAIAIPIFLNQRSRGYDTAAKSDLRQLAELQESLIADEGTYGTIATVQATSGGAFRVTGDVTVEVVKYDTVTGYCLAAKHRGSSVTWYWDSQASGLQPRGAAGCPTTTGGIAGDSVTG